VLAKTQDLKKKYYCFHSQAVIYDKVISSVCCF